MPECLPLAVKACLGQAPRLQKVPRYGASHHPSHGLSTDFGNRTATVWFEAEDSSGTAARLVQVGTRGLFTLCGRVLWRSRRIGAWRRV